MPVPDDRTQKIVEQYKLEKKTFEEIVEMFSKVRYG